MLMAWWTSLVLPVLLFEDAERLVFAPDLFSTVAAAAACVGITIACGLLPVFAISHNINVDPCYHELRADPRFQELVERIHVPLSPAESAR